MALAALSVLSEGCRAWLLFESESSGELHVEFLNRSAGLYCDNVAPSKKNAVKCGQTEANPVPLLVPEFDDGEMVLGHCYSLTMVDFLWSREMTDTVPYGSGLLAERSKVEQRFVILREKEYGIKVLKTTLYDDGCVCMTRTFFGSGMRRGHVLGQTWVSLRRNLARPEFELDFTFSNICERHGEEPAPGALEGAEVDSARGVCSGDSAPSALPAASDEPTSLWQQFLHLTGCFHEAKPFVKHHRFRALESGGVDVEDDLALATKMSNFWEFQALSVIGTLEGTRLHRLKTEYVQNRLDAILSRRGNCAHDISAPTRRFNLLLDVASRTAAKMAQMRRKEQACVRLLIQAWDGPTLLDKLRVEGEHLLGSSVSATDGSSSHTEAADTYAERKKRASCAVCGATFTRKFDLDRHVKSTHLNEKRHGCSRCPRSFYQRSHLLTHVREVHDNVRDDVCKLCGKRFGASAKMKRHVKVVHMNIRPHACTACGGNFSQRSDLKRHVRLQHASLSGA